LLASPATTISRILKSEARQEWRAGLPVARTPPPPNYQPKSEARA